MDMILVKKNNNNNNNNILYQCLHCSGNSYILHNPVCSLRVPN